MNGGNWLSERAHFLFIIWITFPYYLNNGGAKIYHWTTTESIAGRLGELSREKRIHKGIGLQRVTLTS
jgi:hypothetical protein